MKAPQDAVNDIVEQWKDERPDLDTSPMLVVGRVIRLAETLDRRLRPLFAEEGLGNGEFDVLAALRRAGAPYSLTPGELGRAMLVTTGAVTKRVDRLERRGLLTREVSPHDARGRVVTLTDAGVALVDRLFAEHLANQERLLGSLDEAERRRLSSLLAKLAASLERPEEGMPTAVKG